MTDKENYNFLFKNYEEILRLGKECGYKFNTCEYYFRNESYGKTCILRHDVDLFPEKSIEFAKIEKKLGISSTYFFRIHSNEYNCLSYEVISLIRDLFSMGHEIGLHAEPIDIKNATGLDEFASIKIGKKIIEEITGCSITGIASHNDPTPFNNLDFFKKNDVKKLGFLYEAYCEKLFFNSTYITDSHMWYWRTFVKGNLTDEKLPISHYFEKDISPLYLLTHPHCWYNIHYHRVRY